MILIKIGIFAFFALFLIWISNYDPRLHAELDYFFGPEPKKNPSRLLNITLIFLILFGCAVMIFFMPTDEIGVTIGSIIGMVIMAIACVFRTEICN